VKFAFIAAKKAVYPVEVLCSVLEVSRSGYYAWCKRPPPPRAVADAQLAAEIAGVHQRSRRTYGSPRVHADLRAKGLRVSRKRVERVMRENGIAALRKRPFRRTTDSNHDNPIAPNLVDRDFEPEAPNTVWATDVTYIPTVEGWLYLAVILDLFSRRVVGWAASPSNDRELALKALHQAVAARRPPRGLIHHSDRGSPYASDDYRNALAIYGMKQSMSRKADCWDNACAESFFGTLKAELVDDENYPTRAIATASIGDYLENFYNPARRHSFLGLLSPMEFELRSQSAAVAA